MESILDRAQKLLGRGFLIAAFVPSLFFVLCTSILYWGFISLSQHVHELAKAKWKENAFELGLWLLIIYLLAYVLYGTRAFLHQLYQGDWQITLSFKSLKWLEWILNRPYRLGIWLTTRRMRRYQELAEEKLTALDWPNWVVEGHFGDTFSRRRISAIQANKELSSLQRSHLETISSLDRERPVNDHAYWDLLARSQVLRANSRRFDREMQRKVDGFIATIRDTFQNPAYHARLRLAVTRYEGAAERDWSTIYGGFLANFPDDERWMRATQLGALAAVNDLYAYKRYGITLSNLWPRLIQVVPEDARVRLEDANIYLDFTVIMSSVAALLAAVSIGLATWQKNSHLFYPRNILVPVACFIGFVAFYRLSIEATRAFGSQVQAAVDLFRLKLLDALDIKRPSTPTQEKEIWKEIHFFIEQADLPVTHVRFKVSDPEQPPATAPRGAWARLWKVLTGSGNSSDLTDRSRT
jgi:hypothetical protein